MRTVQGSFKNLLECVDTYKDIWYFRFNVRLEIDDVGNIITKWEEEQLDHKPSFSEIKEYIENWVNTNTKNKILTGFRYKGYLIWLSEENQINYKSIYDLKENNIVIKVNEHDYYVFNTFNEYELFYMQMIKFILTTIKEGWKIKDSFDYDPYIILD